MLKIAPETGLKFTFNDRIKQMLLGEHIDRITPAQRMMCGGLAGATAQVGWAAQARGIAAGQDTTESTSRLSTEACSAC